jgi:hypothetical protein
MKFSDDMRFPHPVLTPETGDFTTGTFDLRVSYEEIRETGKATIRYEVDLTEPNIRTLVEDGVASVAAFVRCNDTYYSELHRLSWPSGTLEFAAGALLNRVTVRPLVYLTEELPAWKPQDLHEEFEGPLSLGSGDILAIGYEFVLNVGQARLAPLESIFALKCSPELPEGEIRINLDAEKITILAGTDTHKLISRLREEKLGRPAALNSIYLPAIMDVLDALGETPEAFSGKRWKQPFVSRCDSLGIDPSSTNLFEGAQKLLEHPVSSLRVLVEED